MRIDNVFRTIMTGKNNLQFFVKDSQQMLPNALIFGAKKCGTGTLLEMLDIHPDVHVVHYEVHFFDDNFNNGFEWYRQKMPFSYENQVSRLNYSYPINKLSNNFP